MDIQLKETSVPVCRELAHITKPAQMTMESVVPDTKDDIGRILSVRPEIYLKSKELRTHSAYLEAEARVTVLYVNDTETAVFSFRVDQPLVLEYELPSAEPDGELQLKLTTASAQARAVNPRKVSVDLDIGIELWVSGRDSFVVSQSMPENSSAPVHVRYFDSTADMLSCVCEKNLSVSEQLSFSDSDAKPSGLICKETRYRIRERDAVGSRLLIKGTAVLAVDLEVEGAAFPFRKNFEIPFSQLIDLGEASAEDAEVWIVPTSDYLELIDTIDGQKMLSAELHAVTQVRGKSRQALRYVIDAYSNKMPCECHAVDFGLTEEGERTAFSLGGEEKVELPEENAELVYACPSLGVCTSSHGSVSVDLLLRDSDGKLSVTRRTVALRAEGAAEDNISAASATLTAFSIVPDGRSLNVKLTAEGECARQSQKTLRRIVSLSLDEEGIIDDSSYPSLTAVWAETESVWELAKQYHSSPEAIESWNETIASNPVFIPKTE